MATAQVKEILKLIDQLSLDEKEELINTIKYQANEQRRDEIAKNINKANQEYEQDNVFRGTIDETIKYLNE